MNNKKLLMWAFAVSGMTALIYEIVWARSLEVIFGSTIYAVSTIITTFLIGASLGSFLFRNLAEKMNPIRLFSSLEMGIGIYGLLSIFLFKVIQEPIASINSPILSFVILFLLLIIPTTLFGATWPVIGKAFISKDRIGKDSGVMYGYNSLGSFIGPILAGFALIPFIGIRGTTIIAAIANLLIGAILIRGGKNGP